MEMEKILPVYRVEHDAMISVGGDVTLGYEVMLPEIFTLSAPEYEALHQTWVKAIKALPSHTVLHKQDWFVRRGWKVDRDLEERSFLSRASDRFFSGRAYLDHRCYLYLTKRVDGRRLSTSAHANILRKSIVPRVATDKGLFREFLLSAGQFESILTGGGLVSLRRLGDEELAGTALRPGVIERYCFLLSEGEPSLLRDVELKAGIRVGDKRCELYTLAGAEDLPSHCGPRITCEKYSTDRTAFSTGFASPLSLLLDGNHVYNQYIFLEDGEKTLKKLEAKRLRLQSLSAYSRENALSRDAVNDFLNEAIAEGRLPVRAHVNVLVWSEDAAELLAMRKKVAGAMAELDATCKQETAGAAQIWFAGMPGNAADFPMNDTFLTFLEQACCFLNVETAYRDSASSFGMRLGDRLSGKPVWVDLSDEPMRCGVITNRNKFILGPSGSGKSFFTNHLLRAYFEQGTHVVVVDVGHSYRGLCELTRGRYLTYSESDPICFNPFFLTAGETLDTEKKESLKTLLLALWKKEEEPFSRAEYVALSGAVSGYYQYLTGRSDVFPCFDTFYEYLLTSYRQVLEEGRVKTRDFDLENFLYVLRPYYAGGEFDYLLNARENLDLLHEPFIVFELDNIKDHPILFPVVTIILMDLFIGKMRKLRGTRKLLLLEEVWKALTKKGMEEAIQYWVKTIRKFFGELVLVTQDVEDVIGSKVVKNAIINNSDCKILLDQRKYLNKFSQIQELLGLSDKETAQVLSQNLANDPERRYKEVYLSPLGRVYRTEVSLEEYLCYTTEETEKVKVMEAAKARGSMEKGIKVLAQELRQKNG